LPFSISRVVWIGRLVRRRPKAAQGAVYASAGVPAALIGIPCPIQFAPRNPGQGHGRGTSRPQAAPRRAGFLGKLGCLLSSECDTLPREKRGGTCPVFRKAGVRGVAGKRRIKVSARIRNGVRIRTALASGAIVQFGRAHGPAPFMRHGAALLPFLPPRPSRAGPRGHLSTIIDVFPIGHVRAAGLSDA